MVFSFSFHTLLPQRGVAAVDLLIGHPGFACRDEHWIPHGSKGRGIGEVELHELIDPHMVPQGCGQDIDALSGALSTNNLSAQEATAAAL